MEFEELLNQHFNELNDIDKIIARWLLTNQKQSSRITITNIANNCAVSKSSVFRFSKKLGLEGFNELKYIVSQGKTAAVRTQSGKSGLQYAIDSTMKRFELMNSQPIYEALDQAENVYIYSTGWIQKVVSEQLQRNLFVVGKNALILPAAYSELTTILNRMSSKDILIIVSYGGDSERINSSVRTASLFGIRTISITPFTQNNLSAQATFNFYFDIIESRSAAFDNTLDFYASLFVLDDLILDGYIQYVESKE